MNDLGDYADICGQWGEGGMIAECLRRCGVTPHYAVEFGAGDDIDLLNTLALAEAGVECLWIEADPGRYLNLVVFAERFPNVRVSCAHVGQIDDFLHDAEPDVMSIDVDGEDYAIFERMTARPIVVVVEHHPMIPAHVSYVGGPDVGASALALVELASRKGYTLVGTTHCNCIFVRSEFERSFVDLDTDLGSIFDPSDVTYAVSNVTNGDFELFGNWPFGRREELT
jgi:hypothetical protein